MSRIALLVAIFVHGSPLSCGRAEAYTLKYKVADPDHVAILARVEAATGLNFEGKCEPPRRKSDPPCDAPIHGTIQTYPGRVIVEVFGARNSDKRSRATKVDKELSRKITAAVLNK